MDVGGPARSRGLLPGFANSADLGGLPLPGGRSIPPRRVVRADTPAHLTDGQLTAAHAFGFDAVLDLRSQEEVATRPHPLAHLPGYRSVPLIDPAADAREDFSRYRSLGEIYSSSLERNATHIAAIFAALATVPPGPVLLSCHAGRDRTGMVVALLLDLVGVDRALIEADFTSAPERPAATAQGPAGPLAGRSGRDIVMMLDHVSAAYGSTHGYLRTLGIADPDVRLLRERLEA